MRPDRHMKFTRFENRKLLEKVDLDAPTHFDMDSDSSSTRWIAALLIFSLLLPFQFSIAEIVLSPYRILLISTLPFLLIKLLIGKENRLNSIDFSMLLSTMWGIFALGANHPISQIMQPGGVYFVEFFGAYVVGRVTIRSAADLAFLAKIIVLSACVLAPFALFEALFHWNVILQFLPSSISDNGNDIRHGLRRAQTVFVHPILFGVFASSALGFAWFFSPGSKWILPRVACVLLASLCSMSTGALIALAAQFSLISWNRVTRRLSRRWALLACFLITFYFLVDLLSDRTPFHVLVDYASFNSVSAYFRILIWRYGVQNVIENPIFGIGFNDWVRAEFMPSSVDNYWLLTAMRHGLPTVLFYFLAIFLLFRGLSRFRSADPTARSVRAGLLVSLSGLLVGAGTVHYWHAIGVFLPLLIGSGVWMARPGKISNRNYRSIAGR